MKLKYFVGVVGGLLIAFGFSLLYNKIPEANAAALLGATKQPEDVYYIIGDDGARIKVSEWRDKHGNKCVLANLNNAISLSCYRT